MFYCVLMLGGNHLVSSFGNGSHPTRGRKYEGWETSMLYFPDALIIGHFGLKGELLTSSPTQFETFSDTARFYSSQIKWKSLLLHYRFTFFIIPCKSNESGAGRRLCFWVIVPHHATMQASESVLRA